MEKKKTFGSVLVVLLFSATFPMKALSSGSLTTAYDALEEKKNACFKLAEDGHKDFPNSSWLRSLEEEKQAEVLQYLAQTSFNHCLSDEITSFKKELSFQTKDVQEFIKKYVSLEPYIANAPNITQTEKLLELKSKIMKPFHVSKVKLN